MHFTCRLQLEQESRMGVVEKHKRRIFFECLPEANWIERERRERLLRRQRWPRFREFTARKLWPRLPLVGLATITVVLWVYAFQLILERLGAIR